MIRMIHEKLNFILTLFLWGSDLEIGFGERCRNGGGCGDNVGAGGVDLDMFRLSGDRDRDRRLRFILVLYVCTALLLSIGPLISANLVRIATSLLRSGDSTDKRGKPIFIHANLYMYVCMYVCTLLYPYK